MFFQSVWQLGWMQPPPHYQALIKASQGKQSKEAHMLRNLIASALSRTQKDFLAAQPCVESVDETIKAFVAQLHDSSKKSDYEAFLAQSKAAIAAFDATH